MRITDALKQLDELYEGVGSSNIEIEAGIVVTDRDPIVWEKIENEVFDGAPTDNPKQLATLLIIKYGIPAKIAFTEATAYCSAVVDSPVSVPKEPVINKQNMTPVKLDALFSGPGCASCLFLGIRSTRGIRLTGPELREGAVVSPFWCVRKELAARAVSPPYTFDQYNALRKEVVEDPECVIEPLGVEYISKATKYGDSLHRSAILHSCFPCNNYLRVKGKQYYGRRSFLKGFLYPTFLK